MKYIRIKLISVFLSVFCLTGLQAQQSVNSSGSIASGSGGRMNYSLGQVNNQTYTGTNGSIMEGVQQPYIISVVTSIEEANDIALSVYPNPTTNFLQLIVDCEKLKDLHYQLFDTGGKILQNEKITNNQTGIAMDNLIPAIYFLKVIYKNKAIKIFKIIKN
jgi:hypothetical protein